MLTIFCIQVTCLTLSHIWCRTFYFRASQNSSVGERNVLDWFDSDSDSDNDTIKNAHESLLRALFSKVPLEQEVANLSPMSLNSEPDLPVVLDALFVDVHLPFCSGSVFQCFLSFFRHTRFWCALLRLIVHQFCALETLFQTSESQKQKSRHCRLRNLLLLCKPLRVSRSSLQMLLSMLPYPWACFAIICSSCYKSTHYALFLIDGVAPRTCFAC